MKILKQEDENTRIVQARAFLSGKMIKRQRRVWWGWKTVASLYTFQCDTLEEYIRHFNWREFEKIDIGSRNQF
jgi:hypothetical protein